MNEPLSKHTLRKIQKQVSKEIDLKTNKIFQFHSVHNISYKPNKQKLTIHYIVSSTEKQLKPAYDPVTTFTYRLLLLFQAYSATHNRLLATVPGDTA